MNNRRITASLLLIAMLTVSSCGGPSVDTPTNDSFESVDTPTTDSSGEVTTVVDDDYIYDDLPA